MTKNAQGFYGDSDLINKKVLREDGIPVYHGQDGREVTNPQQYALKTRTIAEKEHDLSIEEGLFLRGLSFQEITERLIEQNRKEGRTEYTISREMVILDCKEMLLRWQQSALKDINEWTSQELRRLDKLEAEYWDAWDRSKERKRLVEVEKMEYGAAPIAALEMKEGDLGEIEFVEPDAHGKNRRRKIAVPRTKTTTTDIDSEGNVLYLQGVERVIEQRLKVLGIGQTKNLNINWRKQAEREGYDPDDLMAKMTEKFIEEGEKKGSME